MDSSKAVRREIRDLENLEVSVVDLVKILWDAGLIQKEKAREVLSCFEKDVGSWERDLSRVFRLDPGELGGQTARQINQTLELGSMNGSEFRKLARESMHDAEKILKGLKYVKRNGGMEEIDVDAQMRRYSELKNDLSEVWTLEQEILEELENLEGLLQENRLRRNKKDAEILEEEEKKIAETATKIYRKLVGILKTQEELKALITADSSSLGKAENFRAIPDKLLEKLDPSYARNRSEFKDIKQLENYITSEEFKLGNLETMIREWKTCHGQILQEQQC